MTLCLPMKQGVPRLRRAKQVRMFAQTCRTLTPALRTNINLRLRFRTSRICLRGERSAFQAWTAFNPFESQVATENRLAVFCSGCATTIPSLSMFTLTSLPLPTPIYLLRKCLVVRISAVLLTGSTPPYFSDIHCQGPPRYRMATFSEELIVRDELDQHLLRLHVIGPLACCVIIPECGGHS
jgi:hypothetical protein